MKRRFNTSGNLQRDCHIDMIPWNDPRGGRCDHWIGNTLKRKVTGAPKLKSLPSTSEAFKQNVRRTHFQVSVWKAALAKTLLNLHQETLDGKRTKLRDRCYQTPYPKALDPLDVLKVIRCGCAMDQPRITARCMCGTCANGMHHFLWVSWDGREMDNKVSAPEETWTVTVMTSTCVITDDRECFEGVIHRVWTDCRWIM